MNDFDRMINNLTLLNNTELEALAQACQTKVEERKEAYRETLRQELMNNLQKAISDVLNNNFYLVIGRRKQDPKYGYNDLWFDPTDQCTIEIEQRETAILI